MEIIITKRKIGNNMFNYNDIAKKYLPPEITCTYIKDGNRLDAAFFPSAYEIESPVITDIATLAIFLHECGHAWFRHTISTSILEEILDTTTFLTQDHLDVAKRHFIQEQEAWDFALAVLKKEKIPVTREVKRLFKRAENSKILYFAVIKMMNLTIK